MCPEKFLDTLNPTDYATFIEALQPELHKAKRVNAGNGVKNIPAVGYDIRDNERKVELLTVSYRL